MTNSIIVAPSILAADLSDIAREVSRAEAAGADWIHIDVMDGSFVPPITFGDNMVRAVKKHSRLLCDVHLMIRHPEKHLATFRDAGADRVIVHVEACQHLHRVCGEIAQLGMKAGVALNPGTPIESIFPVIHLCDLLLVMTVNPGWGGQLFLEECLPKITQLKVELQRRGSNALIEVDGGINSITGPRAVAAGANVLVAGSAIFGASDAGKAIAGLRGGSGK